ncbi:prepilin-type N-terminal cleavage/methylation domain-containing protein [endosymbiont of Lamellibrachia barhami]|uniref:prepilin-type N-terminal cleavage/methylation domain-containing protein n=1 Tax=endosymbiont of Lamellibrachia barhami TaxID=205975 RepID=UPI0015B1C6BD|nr:prepilin-type N-terminal cleavage/methylation domain-containing protein [endosymbiont of Lamellibrachia barhami]
MRMRFAHGFTLLELLLVLTVSGLIIAMVPPLLSRAMPTVNARSAVSDLSAIIRNVRSRAIVLNETRVIYFDRESRTIFEEGGNQKLQIEEPLRIKVGNLNRSEEIQKILVAHPDGSVNGSVITISGGKKSYILRPNWVTGALSIEDRVDESTM